MMQTILVLRAFVEKIYLKGKIQNCDEISLLTKILTLIKLKQRSDASRFWKKKSRSVGSNLSVYVQKISEDLHSTCKTAKFRTKWFNQTKRAKKHS